MSFAALDSYGEPVVIFAVESTAQRTLCLGPVLVHAEITCDIDLIRELAYRGLKLLSELVGLVLVKQTTSVIQ